MVLHFTVTYSSIPGEDIFVRIIRKNIIVEFPLEYKDSEHWQGNIPSEAQGRIQYYIICRAFGSPNEKVLIEGKINPKKNNTEAVSVFHENTDANGFIRLNRTKPFAKILRQKNIKRAKKKCSKKPTHIFRLNTPRLQDHIFVCLTGSAKKTGSFDPQKALLFRKKKDGHCSLKIDFSKENFPIEYKFAFYDTRKNAIVDYEPGPNRTINSAVKRELNIIYPAIQCEKYLWKGAGVNIPVFSLRSEQNWGIGDFTNIHLLVDWAVDAGLKLIQLLPINDTIATWSDKDSYPYSAITSFALHPQFLNVQQVIRKPGILVSDEEQEEIKRLNRLSVVDYAAVMKLKLTVIKKALEKEKDLFRDDMDWFRFFEMNRQWLLPYAVFCTLRDVNATADYSKWCDHGVYDEDRVQEIAAPGSEHYETVLFWYYIQYHLHLQLKDAVEYAHKKGMILKADLPIGVGRLSADTWKNPELFHLDMQAGAPPDVFSDRGQNWGFPTYNVTQMEAENFSWFRRRMEHLDNYFDAVRIDHVLGFFRIWSITQGIQDAGLGRFVPAIALIASDFISAGIDFDEHRFCEPTAGDAADVILLKDEAKGKYHFRIQMQKTAAFRNCSGNEQRILNELYDHYFFYLQNDLWKAEGEKKLSMLKKSTRMLLCAEDLGMVPSFTDEVLHSLDILSLQVQQMGKKDEKKFSDTALADYESVVMPATHDMAPMRLWWEENHGQAQVFMNDILKVSGTAPYFAEPWVCKKIFEQHLSSPAMWSIFLLQDILSVDGAIRRSQPSEERINDPANANQVWNYRMHISLEQLIQEKEFNAALKKMIREKER